MKKIARYILLSFIPLLGQAAINPDTVKDNLISNSRAAINAAKQEQEKLSKVPFIGEAVMAIPSFLPSFLSGFSDSDVSSDSLFDSKFFAAVFNKDQITSTNETQLVYSLDSSICSSIEDQRGQLVCFSILSEYVIALEVNSTNNADYDLNMLAKLKKGEGGFEPLFASSSYRNATGKTVNLTNLFKVITHLGEVNTELGEKLNSMLKSLEGQISIDFNFATSDLAAACQHQARTCVYFNIDKNMSFSALEDGVKLHKWEASPVMTPTFSAFVLDNDHFEIVINSGALAFEAKETGYFLNKGRVQANIIIHPPTENVYSEVDPLVTIKNFSMQEGANSFSLGNQVLTPDFKFTQSENPMPTVLNIGPKGPSLAIDAFTFNLKGLTTLDQIKLYEDVTFESKMRSQFRINEASESLISGSADSRFFLNAIAGLVGLANDLGKIVCEEGDLSMGYKNGLKNDGQNDTELLDRRLRIEKGQSLTF